MTPKEKAVGDLVSRAADLAPGRSFGGYQRPARKVYREIEAIYETVDGLGVHYSPNTRSFLDGQPVRAQRLNLPAETTLGTGGNCMDGALLFASLFEATRLDSYVVVVPG